MKKQYVGLDARDVDLLVKSAGANAARAVALSELTAAKTTIASDLVAAKTALESAYQTADTAQSALMTSQANTFNASLDSLGVQINGLQQGINKKAAVKARFVGLLSALQATSGTFGSVTVASMSDATEPDTALEMLDSSVLLDSTTATESGIYYRNSSGSFVPHTAFDTAAEMPASTLIYVDQGTFANTFWLVADSPTSTAVNIIPFGQAVTLDVAPNTFLTNTANQLNATLNGDYFTVTSGTLTLSAAFLTRVADVETEVLDLQTDLAAVQASVASNSTAIATNSSAITALQSAVAGKATIADVRTLFSAAIKPLTLTGGVYDSGENTTTFYADAGTSGYAFRFGGLFAIATPFDLQSDPDVTRVANPTGGAPALKVVLQAATQIADGAYEALVLVTDVTTLT